ncbi:MAG: hypothetical protein LBT75_04550 [Bacilli bacterium]|jgi:hypothetical protein|nr:hypothetical protein [Bacilli bacterium]
MARKVNSGYSPYAKKRRKVVKNDKKTHPHAHLIDEIKNPKKKTWVYVVIVVIIIVMIGSLILPYFIGTKQSDYSLPDTVLKAGDEGTQDSYSAQLISLGETFNRQEKDYYVIIGKQSDLSSVLSNMGNKVYYFVNTDSAENALALQDVSKAVALPQKASEIKITKDMAMIHIKDGKSVAFYNNKDEILKSIK